jgi:nucleotide-binding universal stress UspA family protein
VQERDEQTKIKKTVEHLSGCGWFGGSHATFGVLLGCIAQQEVEYAIHPVLVVRPPYSGKQRVLLVTDGSDQSNVAVNFLATFPLPDDAQVQVMHVLPPLPTPALDTGSLEAGMNGITSSLSLEMEGTIQKKVEVEEKDG